MKNIIIKTIRMYQKYLSSDTGLLKVNKRKTCVFYPTCSEYTIQAVKKYGTVKGVYFGIKRILRCHPWQKKHIDLLE